MYISKIGIGEALSVNKVTGSLTGLTLGDTVPRDNLLISNITALHKIKCT